MADWSLPFALGDKYEIGAMLRAARAVSFLQQNQKDGRIIVGFRFPVRTENNNRSCQSDTVCATSMYIFSNV